MIGSASIYSLTGEAPHTEAAVWASFSAAKDTSEFFRSWLAILCMQIERVGGALLLLGPNAEGAYVPAAVWPHVTRDMQYLSPAAERTLNERPGIRVAPHGPPPPTPAPRPSLPYPTQPPAALPG